MTPDQYSCLKLAHMALAATSVSLFALRLLLWEWQGVKPGAAVLRIGPHLVDTLLLASGVTLAWYWQLSPFAASWFALKLLLVVVYILLGFAAMRFSSGPAGRRTAGFAALLTAAAIAGLALHKPF